MDFNPDHPLSQMKLLKQGCTATCELKGELPRKKPFFKGYRPQFYFRVQEESSLNDLPKAILLGIPYKPSGPIFSFREVDQDEPG